MGSTKIVAEKFHKLLEKQFESSLFSIEDLPEDLDLNAYDGFLFGYPVYHARPPQFFIKFIESMEPLHADKPAFIFNTRGLYSANSQRILANYLRKKNIKIILDQEYRSPASDISLLMPYVTFVWHFEAGLESKIQKHCTLFAERIEKGVSESYIPRFRFHGILNAPNQLAGRLITFPIHLHRQACFQCGKCIANCPVQAQIWGEGGYPAFQKQKCENCYRCIHHCPAHALSLSRRKLPKRVLPK